MRQTSFPSFDKRIIIFAGAYGSGKTEVAVNYAMRLATSQNQPVTIVDLDIVNPYFRSREAALELETYGVKVVMPPNEQCHADLPIVLPQIKGEIEREEGKVILDVGGDDAGARVLGSLAESFQSGGYELLMVLNAKRPFTSDVSGSVKMMRAIETSSRLRFTGIVSNTHLIGETTVETVADGYRLAAEVGDQMGIAVAFVSVLSEVAEKIAAGVVPVPLFPISRQMLKPWEEKPKDAKGL